MTEKQNGYIHIPIPLLIILVTIVMGVFSYGMAMASRTSGDHNQIQVNTHVINKEIKPEIQMLKDTKVDKADYEWVRASLVRIENKLDAHMDKK